MLGRSFSFYHPVPPHLITPLTLGMAVARICHSRRICHQGNILVAFSRCDVSEAWFCCDAGFLCWTSVVCLEWKGTTLFCLGAAWNAWELVFSSILWPCVCISPQHKPFVVWLIFVRLGLFLKGSENSNRAFKF